MKRYIIFSLLIVVASTVCAQGIYLTSKSRTEDSHRTVSQGVYSSVAVPYTPPAVSSSATFQPSSAVRFQTNSRYSSQVSEIGAAAPTVSAMAKHYAPGIDEGGYDPDNPRLPTPLGSEICLLLILAMYIAVRICRRTIITNNNQ